MKAAGLALVGCLLVVGCLNIDISELSEPPSTDSPPSPTLTLPVQTPTPTPPASQPPVETGQPTPTTLKPTEQPTEAPTVKPTPTNTPRPTPSGDLPAACLDDAFRTDGYRWGTALEWFYLESATPPGLSSDDVIGVIERSFSNITEASNDCGREDRVSAESVYGGATEKEPCLDVVDGTNSIGFGPMPRRLRGGTLAITCPYLFANNTVVEVDILINEDIIWALDIDQCFGFEELLESTMTHEIGHAFGIGHVSERRHGDLTMSTTSNGPCNLDEATLGLGDMLALEELYPIDD